MCASVDNCRLFVGGIPKTKKRVEILAEMKKVTDGVTDVIVYPSAADKTKNRGFAFVEYESHRAAAMARRKLLPGKTTITSRMNKLTVLLNRLIRINQFQNKYLCCCNICVWVVHLHVHIQCKYIHACVKTSNIFINIYIH